MNRIRPVLANALLSICLLAPAAVLAEVKIGFVNTIRLMEEAPQAKAASSKMEAEFAPREKELVSLQREIKEAEETLSRDAAVMSDAQRSKTERDLISRKRDLKRAQDEWREDLNIRRNELLGELQRKLQETIAALAKSEGYDLILEPPVVYFSDRVDITDKVLERLQRDFKSGG